MYGYEWTEENGIFRLTINAKIQKEIRPVFHEELDFFGMDQYWDYPKDTTAPLLWAEGVRRYVLNGVCVAEAQGGGFYTKPTIKRLTEERLKLVPIDTDRLYEVNRHSVRPSYSARLAIIDKERTKKHEKEIDRVQTEPRQPKLGPPPTASLHSDLVAQLATALLCGRRAGLCTLILTPPANVSSTCARSKA